MDFELHLDTETVKHAHPSVPLCVTPEVSIREVLLVMRAQLRGAALICRDGELAGIFTERDALRIMAEEADLEQPIGSVMVSDPVTVGTSETVGQAIALMSSGGYRQLPVVDERQRPVGMLKVSGILHFLVEHFPQAVYTLPPTPLHTTRKREGA